MSSSTSSSEPRIWRGFLRIVAGVFVTLAGATYALILCVDPYGNIPFSLPLERAPVSTNQRFSYPVLARAARFDSAVIGSSTVRLLDPERLDAASGARFVNLAMNSATAYEQLRIHELFLRHHPQARAVIIGIDDSWCRRASAIERYTFREFPEWMYDENPWNDLLYMFNDKALENTVRLIELLAGKRSPKYETNGYRDFTLDFGAYKPRAVARRLYPKGRPAARRIPDIPPQALQPQWQFAAHALLGTMLERTPPATDTVFLFAPMHGDYLARSEGLYRECKARILAIAKDRRVTVFDYMRDSVITREDDNYWDPLHYRAAVARIIEQDIGAFLNGQVEPQSWYEIYPPATVTHAPLMTK